MAVVDASVWVAMLRKNDPFYNRCRDWWEASTRAQVKLYVPSIALAEVAAAVARRDDNNTHAARALELVQESGVEIIDVSRQLAMRAAELGIEYRLRGCDAVYVALAEQLQVTLVTLDREQLERTPNGTTQSP
ncbi:MAG: type II toxin-antitoxin system VapC family toxin [Proteobacteria bacterium]|nr:type II toxin-antitoxin system VapC family toxin [Pseudomonadota bacterium]